MNYYAVIHSPVGKLTLASDGNAITGLWLEQQRYFGANLSNKAELHPDLPVIQEAACWLDGYFSGQMPRALPPIEFQGTTFQKEVWTHLLKIPYGKTLSYAELAKDIGCRSPMAVGQAVARNPISILVPCHRVVGSRGQLTGYAGGIERKSQLLALEKQNCRDRI